MGNRVIRVRRLIGIGLAGTAMVAAVSLIPALPAAAAPLNGAAANGTYLALGDSVAFGYVPPQAVPAPDYLDASSFVGYPEDVAQALHLRVSNASCPGETTASFYIPGAQSNGCENSPGSSVGYRTEYPLHVQYPGTQMLYALGYLARHRQTTRLVTIDIGANDVFLCQETTADACASPAELQAVLKKIEANLAVIYALIRDVARYHGPLVALTYYSLDYADPTQVAGTEALNSAIASVTEKFGGKIADGFAAFEGPSAAFGGSPCSAGLLIKVPGGCNIHPSPEGHQLLAQAIEDVI